MLDRGTFWTMGKDALDSGDRLWTALDAGTTAASMVSMKNALYPASQEAALATGYSKWLTDTAFWAFGCEPWQLGDG